MSDDLPPISALRAFAIAARTLSFKAAAKELNLSPSALSRQIAGLEAQLGTALFRRLNPGLELTEAGRQYRGGVERGLTELRSAQAALVRRSEGPLRISALESFSARWLIPHLPEFEAAHPDVQIEIEATLRYVDFDRDPVDIAIRFGRGPWQGLHAEPLVDTRYFPVCSPALASGQKAIRSVSDLADHTLIHVSQVAGAWRHWLRGAGRSELQSSREATYDHVGIALSAAESGQGVALSTRFLCGAELASGRLVAPLDFELESAETYHLVCREDGLRDPRITAFRDWLVDSLSKSA